MATTPQPIYSGKVRDIYDAGDDNLLFVASDRISAFDVVMAEPIPDKGRVLTAITAFWLGVTADLVPNHLVSLDPPDMPADWVGRTMLVRRAEMLPIECIVRGYLSGSAWKEYRASGTMHGRALPSGLRESERLPEPVFTPSTKFTPAEGEVGHDENISFEQAVSLVGREVAERARDISLAVYQRGAELAAARGIVIADTKFELGVIDGELALCDEVLTPDSSRFWDAAAYAPGTTPPSYDKQPVRDWLEATGWDKAPPPPALPQDVVDASRERYATAYERLSGRSFADWPGVGRGS
ncbi:MAG: Phosphoribosylaminoimidazole-succinocarboxamide synthase [Acidimicrobiales bacterium]|nr:Phosphoribosylaminoimidazole-succinocarboxamide synthase [Acidimicrobiales bacterium]